MKRLFTILIIIFSISLNAQSKVTLTIEFEDIKADNGKVFVALYDQEDEFLKKAADGIIVDVSGGKAKAVFKDLKPGTYAVSSFFDKNDNGKLDTNFLGIPKEPTAMSNNAKASFGPPKFKNAKFSLETEEKTIKINF